MDQRNETQMKMQELAAEERFERWKVQFEASTQVRIAEISAQAKPNGAETTQ